MVRVNSGESSGMSIRSKRLRSAGSSSIQRRYSISVVAATTAMRPLASAALKWFGTSAGWPALERGAKTAWASSMKRMTSPSHSSSSPLMRASSSPR